MKNRKIRGRAEVCQSGIAYQVVKIYTIDNTSALCGTYASKIDAEQTAIGLNRWNDSLDHHYKVKTIDLHIGKIK